MHLLSFQMAPNPKRALAVALEKRVDLDFAYLSRENYREFLRVSPLRKTPVLILDTGEVITESLTISHYLDAVSGAPYLFGETLEDRTRIGMWERRAEFELLLPAIEVYHNIHPLFRETVAQSMPRAQGALARCAQFLAYLGAHLSSGHHVAGADFSGADITAYVAYTWLGGMGVLPEDMPATVNDWASRLSGRPCFATLRGLLPSLALGASN